MSIPLRPFGRHVDQTVSALALGGYHIGQMTSVRQAVQLVHEAIDAGITFLDNAWEYNERERARSAWAARSPTAAIACS